MSSLVLTGDTSGSVTVTVPAVAGSNTATLAAATGTHYPFTSSTAVTCAGQTSIDFTSIPSWVKRITVVFNGVSTSGTSDIIVQLGDAGGFENTGYVSAVSLTSTVVTTTAFTTGFGITESSSAAAAFSGQVVINLLGSNFWSYGSVLSAGGAALRSGGGGKTLSDTLTQIRITTVGGTNTFDTTPSAGSINIMYE